MATRRKEVMSLIMKGMSYDDICASLHCSKTTVAKTAAAVKANGITPESLESLTESDLSEFFVDGRSGRGDEYLEPDYEAVCSSLANVPKMTMQLQWMRYCDCNPGDKKLYQQTQFCKKVSEYARTSNLSARIAHEPGRCLFIDWAGDTLHVTSSVTGRRDPAYLFATHLPYSGLIYAEAFPDMKRRSWTQGHVHAFAFYGGVPDILVPDNCATATDRKGGQSTCINGHYQEFAEYHRCAIVPARVRKPQDKSGVEKAVDLCEMWVLAPLAEEVFHSFDELNEAVSRRVDALNDRPFQQKYGSRREIFESEEKGCLAPLPVREFRYYEWKEVTASPDYHVQVDYMRYSVPCRLVGRKLTARLSAMEVDIMDGGRIVATHGRLYGRKGQYSTCKEHCPEKHRQMESVWSRGRFERWAGEVGPATKKMIIALLDSRPIEAQAYVPCSNILNLSKKGKGALLEDAASKIMDGGGVVTYTRVKNLMGALSAQERQGRGIRPDTGAPEPDAVRHAGRTRGADCCKRGGGR